MRQLSRALLEWSNLSPPSFSSQTRPDLLCSYISDSTHSTSLPSIVPIRGNQPGDEFLIGRRHLFSTNLFPTLYPPPPPPCRSKPTLRGSSFRKNDKAKTFHFFWKKYSATKKQKTNKQTSKQTRTTGSDVHWR